MRLGIFIPILFILSNCNGDVARIKLADNIIEIDPQRACASLPIGSLCGGGKYIGEVGGIKYVTTNSGCSDAITPVCDGTDDYVSFEYENLAQPALEYCANMDFNGHSDWVLPDGTVLAEMYAQQALLGGFVALNYWSRDQYYYDEFYAIDFNDGSYNYWWQDNVFNVRCVRVSPN